MKTLDNIGGHLPSPKLSNIHQGHYQALEEILAESMIEHELDKNVPKYTHTSYAEACRHYVLMGHAAKPQIERRKRQKKIHKHIQV